MNQLTKTWCLEQLSPYWRKDAHRIAALPIRPASQEAASVACCRVALPDWGVSAGVAGHLLIPQSACDSANPSWETVDWWHAIWALLNGEAERDFERQHGPIHSYRFRLTGFTDDRFRHAWVNRIALFLRLWGAQVASQSADDLFGPLPRPHIIMTHDVDALRKTFPIRMKQSAFHLFNAARAALRGDKRSVGERLKRAITFLVKPGNLSDLQALGSHDLRGQPRIYFVYGGGRQRNPLSPLFWLNPSYDEHDASLWDALGEFAHGGAHIGLHPGFESWRESALLAKERASLEKLLGKPITSARQHWLRFSWEKTWVAQEEAGITHDFTLGFNDLPGFRNSAALTFNPLAPETNHPLALRATPLLLMDTQLHDYELLTTEEQHARVKALIDELVVVGGTGAFLFHPHTLNDDYGWNPVRQEVERLLLRNSEPGD